MNNFTWPLLGLDATQVIASNMVNKKLAPKNHVYVLCFNDANGEIHRFISSVAIVNRAFTN